MLGKRGRHPSFRRTASMTGIGVALGDVEEPTHPPPPAAIGCDHVLSQRCLRKSSSDVETADFLTICGLCGRRLAPGRDIYMYRGDAAFCSFECREQRMKQDERKERHAAIAATVDKKDGSGHHPEAETVAAA